MYERISEKFYKSFQSCFYENLSHLNKRIFFKIETLKFVIADFWMAENMFGMSGLYFKFIIFCWANSKLNIFDFQLFMFLKTSSIFQNSVQGFIFDVAISNKFELTIVILIFLNMVVMMVEHYKQPQSVTLALEIINIIFTTVFTLEALIKIIGLRWHYFRRVWNIFDLIIVILSIIGE